MSRRIVASPHKLAEALAKQARCALESARNGHFQPQTLGDCAAALRQASAMIIALTECHPHFPDENSITQSVQAAFWENLAGEE